MAALLPKIFTLTLRTLAKPLAGRFEQYVVNHPRFRVYVVKLAQGIHRYEVRAAADVEGKTAGGKKLFIGELTESKAVELASKVVSEGFMFTVGVALIAFEYDRTRRKDIEKKARDEAFRQYVDELHHRERQELQEQNERQTALVEAMTARINELEFHVKRLEEERLKAQKKFFGLFSLG